MQMFVVNTEYVNSDLHWNKMQKLFFFCLKTKKFKAIFFIQNETNVYILDLKRHRINLIPTIISQISSVITLTNFVIINHTE